MWEDCKDESCSDSPTPSNGFLGRHHHIEGGDAGKEVERNHSVVGFTTGPSVDLRCIFASRSQFGSRREKWKSGRKMRMQWSEESSQCPLSGGDGGGSDWTPGRTIPPSMARVRSFFCDHVP